MEQARGQGLAYRVDPVQLAGERDQDRLQPEHFHALDARPAGAPFLHLGVVRHVIVAVYPTVIESTLGDFLRVMLHARAGIGVAIEDVYPPADDLKPPDARIV